MKTKIIIILFMLSATSAWGVSTPKDNKTGDWSSAAYFVWPLENETQKINILSPDNAWTAIVQGGTLTLMPKENIIKNKSKQNINLDGIAEIGWAPDSSALFLTRSDGGAVGSWYVRIILIKDQNQKEIDITQKAFKDFHKHISKCRDEQPNVVALAWVEGSRKLLLIAESPYHSSCPDMGNFAGYLVSVPSGKIIKRFNKTEMKNRFKQYFGERMKSKYKED